MMDVKTNPTQFKIAVVLIAKNEEQFISKTLDSLLNQELKPHRIIVVNDGSIDKTAEIVAKYKSVELINRSNIQKPLQARKELANTINTGLSKLKQYDDCEFVMKLDADIILPKNYLSKIIDRMNSNPKIAVSSGIIKDEVSIVPRGAGRIVRIDFWKKLGLKYPVNYGFEGYLLLKALTMDYEIATYNDLQMQTQRKTGSKYNPEQYYYYGVGMKALGYTFPFVLIRAIMITKRKPKASFYLLRGFLSTNHNLYEKELRDYVKQTQYSKIKHLRLEYLKRLLNRFRKM